MSKTKEQVERFIEALEDAGYDPRSYSGRGMDGKQCVAVIGDALENVSEWEIAKALSNPNYLGEFDAIPKPRQDSLGLGIVLYWPSYEWPEGRS